VTSSSSFLSLQQKNASLFTSDPLVEYNPTDNTIDYVNATIDLLRQYLKLQAARQQQKVLLLPNSLDYAASVTHYMSAHSAAVQKRMGLNDKEEQERRAFLTQLLKIMNTQLRDTILALSDILSGRTKWNSNFEIFELSIRRSPPSHQHTHTHTHTHTQNTHTRIHLDSAVDVSVILPYRYYEQLRVLFPAKPSSPGPLSASPARKRASPTAIISDPQVRTCPRGKLQQRREAGGERDAVLMIRWCGYTPSGALDLADACGQRQVFMRVRGDLLPP
jgi:hypothetical protein